MLGKFDWIHLLWELLSMGAQIFLGRVLVVCMAVLAIFFPVQYAKWEPVITRALIEEQQKEITETFQPMIDNYVESLKNNGFGISK